MTPRQSMPDVIRFAVVLLGIQAGIWWLGCLFMFFQTSPALAGRYGTGQIILTVAGLAALCGPVVGPLYLAIRLARPSAGTARFWAIGLESFMACFGLAIFVLSTFGGAWSVGTVGLAGLVGGGLSAVAVAGLLNADARRYCARH